MLVPVIAVVSALLGFVLCFAVMWRLRSMAAGGDLLKTIDQQANEIAELKAAFAATTAPADERPPSEPDAS